jgi:ParB/RepB/Spo0J family partition protein
MSTNVMLLDPNVVRPGASYRSAPEEGDAWERFLETVRHCGVIEPIVVGRDDDGYFCRVGHRRRLACIELDMLVPAIERDADPTGVLPIVENTHRRSLRPADLADALTSCRPLYPTNAALARDVGLSESYVANLLRIRKGLHPELWTVFQRHGEGIDWVALAEVCTLPLSEQLEAWAARARGSRPASRKAVSLRALKAHFRDVQSKHGPYWQGYRAALELVLKKRDPETPG